MTPQAQKIYEILSDRNWHCPINWNYADGHTKRITDINRFLIPLNQKIESDWCDCGGHNAKVLKRRIVDIVPVEEWWLEAKYQRPKQPVPLQTLF